MKLVRARHRTALGLCLVIVCGVLLAGCDDNSDHRGGGAGGTPAASPSAKTQVLPPNVQSSASARLPRRNIFSSASFWRARVRNAPVNANSRAIVSNLTAQVRDHWGGIAAFNYTQYNVSFYTVAADQTRTTVFYDDCEHRGASPPQLYNPQGTGAFQSVPIPSYAVPTSGTDSEMSLYDPSTDQLWEFWQLRHVAGIWQACWGGRIDHVSRNPGFFSAGTGAAATGLALAGGAIGTRELRKGRINHAMNLGVIDAANWRVFSYPAQRSDGTDPENRPDAIPEGLRFRLDPRVDVNRLPLSRVGKIIARAAQQYGFIVTDKSGAVSVQAESGNTLPSSRARDPWPSLLRGVQSWQVLQNFPWHRLQALPVDWGRQEAAGH